MGIINREKDQSERRTLISGALEPLTTGVTYSVASMPWPCILEQIMVSAVGLSGAPVLTPIVLRFIPSVGLTAITAIGQTLTLGDYGTSGVLGFSLVSQGSTSASLCQLLAGDILALISSGANTAAASAQFGIVVKPTQDIKTFYGISTMLGFAPV